MWEVVFDRVFVNVFFVPLIFSYLYCVFVGALYCVCFEPFCFSENTHHNNNWYHLDLTNAVLCQLSHIILDTLKVIKHVPIIPTMYVKKVAPWVGHAAMPMFSSLFLLRNILGEITHYRGNGTLRHLVLPGQIKWSLHSILHLTAQEHELYCHGSMCHKHLSQPHSRTSVVYPIGLTTNH
jgi:hypothetical protein